MPKLYAFPKFSYADNLGIRLGGPGLGNLLFPLARAIVYSHKNNIPMINPTWINIKVGPIIRKERDKRFYFNLFEPAGITGFKKYFLLNTLKKVPESHISEINSDKDAIMVFSSLRNYFEDIKYDHEIVKEKILKIVKNRFLDRIDPAYNCIGLHLRLGDFTASQRMNLNWCIEVIRQVRKVIGSKTVLLFSDGKDADLDEIFRNINHIEKVFFGNAISDLIALSRCEFLIASDSTFSGWVAYLGRMPVIFQKRHFNAIYYKKHEIEILSERTEEVQNLLKATGI